MWHRRLFSACLVVLTLAGFSACGSESSSGVAFDEGDTSSSAITDESGISLILDDGEIYSIKDFESAGYKKVTQFELETLPSATDAWYGFFNQKDFEIRIYPSHQVALDEGVEPAEFAIGKGAVPWQKRPPVRFDAYAVVGNVVMLCELEVASCEALIAQLK